MSGMDKGRLSGALFLSWGFVLNVFHKNGSNPE
jgi:hypothetical protein